MQTPVAPDSVEATRQMKMASEIIDRHRYLNMAHAKSAKSNVSASAVYTERVGDSKNKVCLCWRGWSVPKEEGKKLDGHERLRRPFDF